MPVSLTDLVTYLDSYLRVAETPDDERALNGLQVENAGTVTRIVAAVDVCEATIREAISRRADLMLVHHGLFWGGLKPLTGVFGRRAQLLTGHGVALYSAHLPLDCHPEIGNNVLLARKVGLTDLVPFGTFEGIQIGYWGRTDMSREDLLEQLQDVVGGAPRLVPGGPPRVARVGVVSGAGTSALQEAVGAGLDTLITGEGPHHSYLEAEELGVNLIFGGHYATETMGVQELAAHAGQRFALPWDFADHPTGM
ncbi:MAG: Nif3-like dinuclear metal center hexameric protein [Gemmatimonadetes bacterium]|nr:Nif3-like dinuclear metal center hexameric protein [Gemmatimonadota bacterium]